MAKSTAKARPEKPHLDFPRFPHRNGQWAKKVRGDLLYFGRWDDPDAALHRWLDEKDDLLAGRTPRQKTAEGGRAVIVGDRDADREDAAA